jgi:GNAT superfamily N-acetyltransferase
MMVVDALKFYNNAGKSGKEDFGVEGISDVLTVGKLREGHDIAYIMAATFFVSEVGRMKFAYVASLKVAEDLRGTGLGTQFLKDLEEFMAVGLVDAYTKAYIILNSRRDVYNYYIKRGFTSAPLFLAPWELDNCSLLSKKIKDDDDNEVPDPSKFPYGNPRCIDIKYG